MKPRQTRVVAEPPGGISKADQRICELAELGLATETIAERCRLTMEEVDEALNTRVAKRYRDYLVVQRSNDMEFLDQTWRDLEIIATERLMAILTDPDASHSVHLNTAKEVFDRHPDRRLVKTNREERVVSGAVKFDVNNERERIHNVYAEVLPARSSS